MPTMPNARTEENANRRIGETAAWSNRESATVINRSALNFTVSPFRHFAVSTSLTGLLLTLLSGSAVHAATSNPYGGIVDRNVFSLKPAPLVDPTPVASPTPPVKLTLNGITTILGNKRALLHAQIPPRPPEPAKEENYMLTEGQRDGGVEVLSIDEHAGIVKVNNNGLTETLDFVNNGAKAVASAAPVGSNIPLPVHVATRPSNSSGSVLPGGISTALQRTSQVTGGQAAAPPSNGVTLGGASSSQQNLQQNRMTPEEQVIMIEAQREYFIQQEDSTATILPPTEMTPTDSPVSGIELPQ